MSKRNNQKGQRRPTRRALLALARDVETYGGDRAAVTMLRRRGIDVGGELT